MKHAVFFGRDIILSEHITEGTTQRRTHKKKRINKKWRKRYGIVDVPSDKFMITDNAIIAHPKLWKKIKPRLEKIGGLYNGQ